MTTQPQLLQWSNLQKWSFRFFFIYFFFFVAPWRWFDNFIPGITNWYQNGLIWVVQFFNITFYHFPISDYVSNGSGDTSFSWEETFTYLIIAATGMLVWSIIDRKRTHYTVAAYWMRTFLRYYIIIICLVYGADKLYALQMPFPNTSQLATPLGDFLPMRLSWMFIGYSTPYQMFSGAMEVLAGLLLLNRRTVTLGLFVALAVFTNVMMMNLSYDIPVKLFSIHLVLICSYLLLNDAKRLVHFFIFNKAVDAIRIYEWVITKKWHRIGRIVAKIIFILLFVVAPFFSAHEYYSFLHQPKKMSPFKTGLYDVAVYAVNRDTVPALITDTLRWSNLVFDTNSTGSVGSTDTAFRQRYRRGYFNFSTDTIKRTIQFTTKGDTIPLYVFNYSFPDSSTIQLTGKRKTDSVFVVLKKSKRHFQLAERQFHWISEANR